MELGLIGHPLGHSFSPSYFSEKFGKYGVEGSYTLFPIKDISSLNTVLDENPGLRGFNVTIPYKRAILPYLDSVSPEAESIGAVNTVKIEHKSGQRRLVGYNTDYIGFSRSLLPFVNSLAGLAYGRQNALILGTGGASKAVAYALDRMGVKYRVASRNPGRKGITTGYSSLIGYGDINQEMMESSGLIVNCTPLGMYPEIQGCPDIPWDYLDSSALCYDLVYNPPLTEFMRIAATRGAAVKNGLEMLHKQADAAWEIWTDSM